MQDKLRTFGSAIVAGMCITLGCVVFLSVGGPLGAFMFSFGLLSVILWKFSLYTGAMGFAATRSEFWRLWLILAGNIVGCALAGLSIGYTSPELSAGAAAVVAKHMSYPWLKTFILSIWCGFIMTVIVRCGRMQPVRQLGIVVLGVAVFIVSGFIHSIADAGYIFLSPIDAIFSTPGTLLAFYITIVVGNFIGGNLVRLLQWQLRYTD